MTTIDLGQAWSAKPLTGGGLNLYQDGDLVETLSAEQVERLRSLITSGEADAIRAQDSGRVMGRVIYGSNGHLYFQSEDQNAVRAVLTAAGWQCDQQRGWIRGKGRANTLRPEVTAIFPSNRSEPGAGYWSALID